MAKRAAGRVRWGSVWLLCVLMLVLVLERFQLIAGRMKASCSEQGLFLVVAMDFSLW